MSTAHQLLKVLLCDEKNTWKPDSAVGSLNRNGWVRAPSWGTLLCCICCSNCILPHFPTYRWFMNLEPGKFGCDACVIIISLSGSLVWFSSLVSVETFLSALVCMGVNPLFTSVTICVATRKTGWYWLETPSECTAECEWKEFRLSKGQFPCSSVQWWQAVPPACCLVFSLPVSCGHIYVRHYNKVTRQRHFQVITLALACQQPRQD